MNADVVGDKASGGGAHMKPSDAASFIIERGTCFCIYAYDIGQAIDLTHAETLGRQPTQRETLKHKRRTPSYFEYRPLPVRFTQERPPVALGEWRTDAGVDCVLYDFGAVSVIYTIPLQGSLPELAGLSDQVYESAALLQDSRRAVEELLERIRPAVEKADLAPLVEDYTIYHVIEMQPPDAAAKLVQSNLAQLAQILRADRGPLSEQEVADAAGCRISYRPDDLVMIDWHAALIVDREAEDVRAVLEFANVELLEMRFLDERLDRVLDEAYRMMHRRRWWSKLVIVSGAEEIRRLGRLQVDAALLFEQVNNALKLLGDQYLARVYRLASQRLHTGDWENSILRKLETVESIYSKLSDYQAARRMELLEWIIIALIAISTLLAIWIPASH